MWAQIINPDSSWKVRAGVFFCVEDLREKKLHVILFKQISSLLWYIRKQSQKEACRKSENKATSDHTFPQSDF